MSLKKIDDCAQRDDMRTEINVVRSLGSSSSNISAGNLSMNFPMAMSANARHDDRTAIDSFAMAASAIYVLKHACRVIKP